MAYFDVEYTTYPIRYEASRTPVCAPVSQEARIHIDFLSAAKLVLEHRTAFSTSFTTLISIRRYQHLPTTNPILELLHASLLPILRKVSAKTFGDIMMSHAVIYKHTPQRKIIPMSTFEALDSAMRNIHVYQRRSPS
jgi:hypothetical protein